MVNPKSILLRVVFIIIGIVVLNSCASSDGRNTENDQMFPVPVSTDLFLNNGYKFNQLTNAEIELIIKEDGDTLITGVPISIIGKTIDPNTVETPVSKPIQNEFNRTIKRAHPNRNKCHTKNTKRLSSQKLLFVAKQVMSKEGLFTNQIGKAIRTGVSNNINGFNNKAELPKVIKAQSPRFKDDANTDLQYLDVVQGMPSSYVLSLMEAKNGIIWFGTQGGGVTKYDGESFKSFTNKQGLSNDLVSCLFEDRERNIWIGTEEGGLCKYDGINFLIFDEKEGLTSNKITAITQDNEGRIWFGTDGGGVSVIKNKSITHFTIKQGLNSNHVRDVMVDKNENVWIGTLKGVNRFNGGVLQSFANNIELSDKNILTIEEDNDGNIWFGTSEGAYQFTKKFFSQYNLESGLRDEKINEIHCDETGNIWFGTDGGLSKYDGQYFTHFSEKEGLSNNRVNVIHEDSKGNIWFGTNGGGTGIYKRKSFTHFSEKSGLPDQYVLASIQDSKGDLWFGTSSGLSRYDGEKFTHYTTEDGIGSNYIRSIIEDKKGNLWLGTKGGVSVYNGHSIKNYTTKNGLSDNYVRSLLEDHEGNIWMGTSNGGLCKFNGESFIHYSQKEGLSNNSIWSILEDKEHNLWVATNGGGVNKIFGDSIIHITETEGLSNNHVRSINEAENGDLWFSTWDGLSRLAESKSGKQKFTYFTTREGLSENVVWSSMFDEFGNLWVCSENGLNQLSFFEDSINDQGQMKYRINQFLKNDGLKGLDFYANSDLIDNNNRAWWGSGKSLTMLDLNDISKSNSPPVVHFREIDINGRKVDYRTMNRSRIEFTKVKEFENFPIDLNVPYEKNHLTFYFSAIEWSAPHKIRYSYVMEGLNDNWSNPSGEAKADYRNLPYGSFTFKVKAIGDSQEWSEVFEYQIKIRPPWYHTWLARILFAIIALIIVFGIIKWQTSKLKQRQAELESEVENATQEIRDKKEQIEEVHKEITDSINYAERIQRSFLATEELLNKNLNDYFVFFQPKDIVSGDFYWADELSNGQFAMVNADSTGHGVPGAIMSILNISSIEKAVEFGLTAPKDIFNETRKTIIERLSKDGSEEGGKDGMDASIICFDFKNNAFHYTAAQNPIWIIRSGELIEIKPEKMPMGKHDFDHIPFVGGSFNMKKGDVVYTLTDGYQDQFGGPKGKKFKTKPLKKILIENVHLSMGEQKQLLKETFESWRGELEQVDDVCVIGVRI